MLSAKPAPWEISDVADVDDLRGRTLYDALMRIKPEGLVETDWAQSAGVNRGFFTNLKNSEISPRTDTLSKLLKRIGRSQADLHNPGPTRQWAGSNPQPDLAEADEAGHRSDRTERPGTRSADAGETVEIAKLDLSLPMGPGATVDQFIEDEPLKFDLGYVRSFTRTPPHRLRLAGGAGDSMFPTLVPNDLVWIDTTQNQLLHADRIYAASINGGAAIKRLRPVAGGKRVLVISDNKTVDPYEVRADEVVIWGRVIRFARDL